MTRLQNLVPFLWYTKHAEQAAKFYTTVFPDSGIDRITSSPADSPSGPAGSVRIVDFTLMGVKLCAMSAGPLDAFNHSISLMVLCDSQAEIDRYWTTLVEHGGTAEPCGWVKDRFGVMWQITPRMLMDLWASPDRDKAKRAMEAMMTMQKLDIAKLQAAFDGRA